MTRTALTSMAFGAFFSLHASPVLATTISFFDGTFAPANWTVDAYVSDGAQYSVTQIASGGDPGPYQQVSISPTYWTDLGVLSSFSYTPSVQGAIQSLSMSIDVINPSGSPGQGDGLLIHQGANWWYAGYGNNTSQSWQTLNISGMTQTGWSGSPGAPDFSVTGGTIQFGYIAANSQSYSTAGVDNFSVTLETNPIPEPLSLIGFGAGVTGLLAARRTRKPA